MTANPVELIGGFTTTANVSKSDIVAWAKARVPQALADATELRNTNLVGQLVVTLKSSGGFWFQDTADFTTVDDGVTCIVSSDGKRFKVLTPTIASMTSAINSAIATAVAPGGSVALAIAAATREKLTGNRTYYFRSDGSDSNNGLTNSAGGAFLTATKAFQVITATLDLAGFIVTVQRGDAVDMTTQIAATAWVGGGNLVLDLNSRTLNVTSADAITCSGTWPGYLVIKNATLQTTTSGHCINHNAIGTVYINSGITFGACAGAHMQAAKAGSTIGFQSNYTISGGGTIHYAALHGGFIQADFITVTLTGTPAFSLAFAYASDRSGVEAAGATFSGSATGIRYNSNGLSFVNSFGGGANFFPGNSAGSTSTGGQYA